jgi:hypothetical protein
MLVPVNLILAAISVANASEASGSPPSATPIRGLLAVFASAFTSQGLGSIYHGGPVLLAGTALWLVYYYTSSVFSGTE